MRVIRLSSVLVLQRKVASKGLIVSAPLYLLLYCMRASEWQRGEGMFLLMARWYAFNIKKKLYE